MKTSDEAIKFCLSLEGVYEDMPFTQTGDKWVVIRHKAGKKCFAFIFERHEHIWINLKCEPMMGDFLRQAHASILPAYHMNKTHWVSVILDGTIADDEIKEIIVGSYNLTKIKHKS